MGYKNRYLFIKRTYPNTIVVFKNKKNNYVGYMKQKEFLDYLCFKKLSDLDKLKINYIVISNMNIINYMMFDDNMYEFYYTKFGLFKIISYIKNC